MLIDFLRQDIPRILLPIPGNAHCTAHKKIMTFRAKLNMACRWLPGMGA